MNLVLPEPVKSTVRYNAVNQFKIAIQNFCNQLFSRKFSMSCDRFGLPMQTVLNCKKCSKRHLTIHNINATRSIAVEIQIFDFGQNQASASSADTSYRLNSVTIGEMDEEEE